MREYVREKEPKRENKREKVSERCYIVYKCLHFIKMYTPIAGA